MGICFLAYSVSPSNLALIRSDPPLVWRVLEAEDESSYLRQLAADGRTSWLQRLLGKARPAAPPRSLVFEPGELNCLDLDKSWDGVRRCIQLCAPEAPDFFEGEGPIGEIDVGYGPALYVESQTLARFAAALDGIEEERLLGMLGRANFDDVYLGSNWAQNDEECRSYLLENFRELRAFAKHCAAHEQAAILQFC